MMNCAPLAPEENRPRGVSGRHECRVFFFRAGALGGLLWMMAATLLAGGGALEVRKGYFWDPTTARFFYPHGIAYQSWNPPVGANQSLAQVEYDLIEFKKMHANSVRAEMVWNVVETSPGQFDWTKPDFLVQQAEKLGLKLFILIGFQYAPAWFPQEWNALNDQNQRSFVLNYENQHARAAYSNYIAQVTSRYRDSRAIAAWILGNEYAYFDLWEPERHYLGYDPDSMAGFRAHLRTTHLNDIERANAAWGGTRYASFDEVPMPREYPDPAGRAQGLFNDLIQWRKLSIAGYVAAGAQAARRNDPNHLLTYSMIGGLFGDSDAYYTCEDGRTIVQACAAAGAPLDFWSINNYAIAGLDSELRIGDFGIAKHQVETGLPVLLSETGHTSTENLHPGADIRQAAAVPTQLWEAVVSGAMGVHLFTWNDRDFFSGDYFPREKGFGIVAQTRQIKTPIFDNVSRAYARMDELDVANLVAGSTNPPNDIQIFWTQASDLGWPRANQEMNRVWDTLKRLGYQPGILRDEEFDRGEWRTARALMLSRAFQMNPAHLETLATEVIAAGVHLHAAVDLPGQFDAYHRPNPEWANRMTDLFGLDVSGALVAFEAGPLENNRKSLKVQGDAAFGPFPAGYRDALKTWKYWQGIRAVAGTTVVRHTGTQPALHLRSLSTARTAITPLALGDITEADGDVAPHNWDLRHDWLRAIYREHFGMTPPLDLSGPGSQYVFPDYRVCRNGSILVGLLNGHTNPASVVLRAPTLLAGRAIENLTSGGLVPVGAGGEVSVPLEGDQYVLLYATARASDSLVNPSPVKLWFESSPSSVLPDGKGAPVVIGYDTQGATVPLSVAFESVGPPSRPHGVSPSVTVTGKGRVTLTVPVPDADLQDPRYVSASAGGNHVWHAFTSGTAAAAHARLPVRLAWGVRAESLPTTVRPGQTHAVSVRWEELPSYLSGDLPTSLDRAMLWDSLSFGPQQYSIILELKSGAATIARGEFVTGAANGTNVFQIPVPREAKGPFTWIASAQTADGASDDILDSFEGRMLGADTERPSGAPLRFAPWTPYHYQQNSQGENLYFDTGVQLAASDGSQSAFLLYTNPPTVGTFSGFGVERPFAEPLSLPDSLSAWKQYSFSCDLREVHGHPLNVDLQIKSPSEPGEPVDRVHAIQFQQAYTAADGGWQRIRATLDQFEQPDFLGRFDRNHATALVINVEMLETDVVYEVWLDNIRWDGPERLGLPGEVRAVYRSDNDSPAPLPDADGDGIPDAFETGTGRYAGPTDTGTLPGVADSDGDGQSDGDELAAGTDPNRAADFFRVESVRWDESGHLALSWRARAGGHYAVSFADDLQGPGAEFFPVPGLGEVIAATDGALEVADLSAPLVGYRFYRVSVLQP